jgi:hypothetical protein
MAELYNEAKVAIDEFVREFKSSTCKRGYDNRFWMKYIDGVFDILWSNKLYQRAFYLNSLCARYLSESSNDKREVFIDEIFCRYSDLCLMAELMENNSKE